MEVAVFHPNNHFMNSRQENKLSNFLVRQVYFEGNAAITATVPALAAAITDWEGTVALIQTLGNQQGTNLTGLSLAKNNLRKLMATRAMIVRNKIGPYAHVTGNAELAARVNVTASDFTRGADTEADDIAIRILEAAEAHEAALVADYGLKAGQIDDLESAIQGYSALIGRPMAAIKSRRTTTQKIDTEFDKADAALKNVIDPLIFSLELEHPAFVEGYRPLVVVGGNGGRAPEKATAMAQTPTCPPSS